MGKTYRRKNFESSCGKVAGSSIAGFYTVMDYNWRSGLRTYREPSDTERFESWYYAHGESKHANYCSPSKWYRNQRAAQNRRINKNEIYKAMKIADYEPLCEQNPRSCRWDWR